MNNSYNTASICILSTEKNDSELACPRVLKLHADPEDREKKMKKNHQNIFRTSGGPVYARLLSRINRANISVSEREGRKKLKTWIGILSILY